MRWPDIRLRPSRDLIFGTIMKIDIDQLTEAELIDLNHRIVERLRFLDQMRAHVEMLDFKIGDRVTFQPPGQGPLEGMLTRYNRKTVTVITDDGRQWNVSPAFLSRVEPAAANSPLTKSFAARPTPISWS